MNNATTTCNFTNARWIQKSGEIRTLEPLETANTNVNFQFSSSTCYSQISEIKTASTTLTYGEILISFFLFIIMLGSVFGFIINKFLTDKQK
jgi:hypothetical protein